MAKWRSGARGRQPVRGADNVRGGRGRGTNSKGRGATGWVPQEQRNDSWGVYGYSGATNQLQQDIDFTLGAFADAPSPAKPVTRGGPPPSFRGRGRGTPVISRQTPLEITFPGNGFNIPRRHIQSIGVPKYMRPGSVPSANKLSNLLSKERPFLRPIKFVPSMEARFLFRDEEELLQPVVEDLDDTSYSSIPTADRVTRIFSVNGIPPNITDNEGTEDEIEEVDFNDFQQLTEVDLMNASNTSRPDIKESSRLTDRKLGAAVPLSSNNQDRLSITEQSNISSNGLETIIQHTAAPDDGDDIIVYEAPLPRGTLVHPREYIHGHSTLSKANSPGNALPSNHGNNSTVTPPKIPSSPDITPSTVIEPSNATPAVGTGSGGRLRVPPVSTPRQAKLWRNKHIRASKKKTEPSSSGETPFGANGVIREEELLRMLDEEPDKKYNERRRGDSDLEWGDTTDNDDNIDQQVVTLDNKPEFDEHMERVLQMLHKGKGKEEYRDHVNDFTDDHGMEVDVDIDIVSMRQFVEGVTGSNAGRHITFDDIECEDRIRMEDQGDVGVQRGSSGDEDDDEDEDEEDDDDDEEEEEILKIEETKFMQDGDLNFGKLGLDSPLFGDDDDDDDDEDSEDDRSFEARLHLLRAKSLEYGSTFGDGDDIHDEAFIQYLNNIVDGNDEISVDPQDRQHLPSLSPSEKLGWTPNGRHKSKYLPAELAELYERDRQKKAQWKIEREQQRLATAADPFAKKKGGKKGRKAMLAAAAIDPTILALPNRVIDMTSLVAEIRKFIDNVGGKDSMSLPPTDKETRKNVHLIAMAFNLKSVSKGKGNARYTTLLKTSRSGIQINEAKIASVLRRSGAWSNSTSHVKNGRKVPRHKEGDVVGKTAPRLDKSNVGFQLLMTMGWAEGDRIGVSTKGLEEPLHAIIKTSKSGLGANKVTN